MKKNEIDVGSEVRIAERVMRKHGFMRRWYKGQSWKVLMLLGDHAVLSDGGPFVPVSDLVLGRTGS